MTTELWECPRCRYRSAARGDGWGMNPRQGYAVCPTCWSQGWDMLPRTVPPPPDDAPTPDDAGMLSSWSGHDWYADLGGEGGHE